jgi:cytolethal distending toxin subunit B
MRLVTWNMQGAKHATEQPWRTCARQFFVQHGADVVCLQECGSPPASAEEVTNAPTSSEFDWDTTSRKGFQIAFCDADPGGRRCNLAILTKEQPVETKAVCVDGAKRPVLGADIGGVWVFCVHARADGGSDARALVNAAAAAAGTRPWVVAGDFNCLPSVWEKSGYDAWQPNADTHPNVAPHLMLDYVVAPKDLWTPCKGTVLATNPSDHRAVLYELAPKS